MHKAVAHVFTLLQRYEYTCMRICMYLLLQKLLKLTSALGGNVIIIKNSCKILQRFLFCSQSQVMRALQKRVSVGETKINIMHVLLSGIMIGCFFIAILMTVVSFQFIYLFIFCIILLYAPNNIVQYEYVTLIFCDNFVFSLPL